MVPKQGREMRPNGPQVLSRPDGPLSRFPLNLHLDRAGLLEPGERHPEERTISAASSPRVHDAEQLPAAVEPDTQHRVASVILAPTPQLVDLDVEDVACPVAGIEELALGVAAAGFLVHLESEYDGEAHGQACAHLLDDRVGTCGFCFDRR